MVCNRVLWNGDCEDGNVIMKIVITGGSGFIGTNLIERFMSENYDVCNLDFNEPKISEHKSIWKNVDLRVYTDVERELISFNPDYIVHLAARTDLDGKTIADYDSNTLAVENLLRAIKKLDNLKKIIITSSMLVCKVGYIPKSDRDFAPSTLYGESKVITENLVWKTQPDCDWAIVRPTSIWGPWFGAPYRNFFDMVIARKYFHIGNKGCTKTYGYVGNAIYEIEKILFSNTTEKTNKVFYIGDYVPTNIEDWANEIANQLGYKILKIPFWMICCAAFAGDMLKKVDIKFPMTSFRLKNMTTDNVVSLENTKAIVGKLKFDRIQGIEETLDWLKWEMHNGKQG